MHNSIIEHLNAEIALNTITDVTVAIEWLKSTYFYVRIRKNPTFYNVPQNLPSNRLEKHLKGNLPFLFVVKSTSINSFVEQTCA